MPVLRGVRTLKVVGWCLPPLEKGIHEKGIHESWATSRPRGVVGCAWFYRWPAGASTKAQTCSVSCHPETFGGSSPGGGILTKV